MSTLSWIVFTSVIGGVASVALAGIVALSARATWIPTLVSYAIGALLGAAFLEILPEAFQQAKNVHTLTATVLAGILAFFVLEKLVLWRHCHYDDCEAHAPHESADPAHAHHASNDNSHGMLLGHAGHHHGGRVDSGGDDHGRSGLLILIGDSFHNFCDGILIAAAFMDSTQLGLVTAAAVIAHEIPQEIGDFVILLHSGYSKARAFALNLLSSFAMLVGGLLGYFLLQELSAWINTVLALAAASMIYVAVADLIPGLHRRPELKATLQQVVLIALGVASIWGVTLLVGEA
jgi:zinc and cadmium transporter